MYQMLDSDNLSDRHDWPDSNPTEVRLDIKSDYRIRHLMLTSSPLDNYKHLGYTGLDIYMARGNVASPLNITKDLEWHNFNKRDECFKQAFTLFYSNVN